MDGVRRPLHEVTTKMPASKHGDVQADKYDGRKFITMRVSSNAEPAYRKLCLRTKDHPTARRRARAVEHLDDVEEARKVRSAWATAGRSTRSSHSA